MTFLQRHAYDIGAGLASLLWPFFHRRRQIAIENILRAGVASDRRTAARIARRSFGHFAGHICEALFVPRVVNADNWREHLDMTTEADATTVRLLLETPDTPILLASSHHGVWEAATNILSFARPMIAIARLPNNGLVTRWMKNHHFRGPVTIVNKNQGMSPDILRKWREDCAAMTILMDQYTHGGLLLKFFGRPARTFTSVSRLAMRTGFPIVVGSFVRLSPYRYRLVGGSPIRVERGADLAQVTQLLNDRLEEAIRRYPEQYLWVHRRWRDD